MFCLLARTNPLLAQWVQESGPSGVVFCLAVSGSDIFAGTQHGGVYLSTNSGTSWTASMTYSGVWAFAISGNNIFAGAGGGVYLSTNSGTTWTAVDSGLGSDIGSVTAFAVRGSNIFAGTMYARRLSFD